MKTYRSDDGHAAFVTLSRGEDVLDGLERAVAELGYRAATIQLIGGLDEAVLGYFDREREEYLPVRTGQVELTSGLGNLSIRDGQPFIHLHLTVANRDGSCMGGHAMEGCRTFVLEAYLRELGGEPPVRQDVEGMPLKVWPGA
jgi:uncharacterized protein